MPINVLRKQFVLYILELIHDSRTIGIVLLSCSLIALLVANLPFGQYVVDLLHAESSLLHRFALPHTPLHIINDGFMAVFFFLAGLEIRRELTDGELSSIKQALLPVGAAVGGMIMPAIIYLLITKGTAYQAGWGIPMATDIAFSLGVASLLGKMFKPRLKIFLVALAIIDDLGAIVIIALFYGGTIKPVLLFSALVVIIILAIFNRRKRAFGFTHITLGLILWMLIFNSGLHATIAGVVFAFFVPYNAVVFLEDKLHNPVNFIILPLFALANSAIVVNSEMLNQLNSPLSWGIFLGLIVGKPLGITLVCRFLVAKRWASLPFGVNWSQMIGAGILASIGFTMSIFIATLAFKSRDTEDLAKLAILFSVVISVALSAFWFGVVVKRPKYSKMIDDYTNRRQEQLPTPED